MKRCAWADKGDELMARYHDEEWGVPVHDDAVLFEFLLLEGAQAGLSWRTILRKREGYRRAFDGFDARKIARYDGRRLTRMMHDEGIVRNKLKLQAAVANANAFLALRRQGGLDPFVWSFVGGAPVVNRPASWRDIAARSEASDALSVALRERGFKFVGSTIVYAFMQACGLVDDHERRCFRCRPTAAPKATLP